MAKSAKTKYQANNGDIHPIRLNVDTIAAAGTVPAGAVTNSMSANVRKGRREYGLGPRGVNISRTVTSGAVSEKYYAFIPVLSLASFETGNFVVGGTITYKTQTWTVESLSSESKK